MAQFSYSSYVAQQQAKRANSNNAGNSGVEVHFLGEYLKNDGDMVVVRFPYHSMDDIVIETTHLITFPGRKYPSKVRCAAPNCKLCEEGISLQTRFFAKLLAYVVDDTTGEVKIVNTVWDRPSAFADIDIKNLMEEYGDLTQNLFKIKRNGVGTNTRYTISIVTNTTVYNPTIYKPDFTELEKVDGSKIFTKTLAQYEQAINPNASVANETPNQVAQPETSQPINQPPISPTVVKPVEPTTQPQVVSDGRQKRYTF